MPVTQSPTLPKYDDLFKPTLEALSSLGGSGSIEELDDALISSLGINQEQLDVTYPKSGAPVLPDRMSWARSFLKIGGFVKNPKRGVWVLTEEGRAALSKSNADLKKIISAADRAAIAARSAAQAAAEGSSSENGNGDSLSWPNLLLQRVQAVEPAAFERLCQRLLRESGFTRVVMRMLASKIPANTSSTPSDARSRSASPVKKSAAELVDPSCSLILSP